MEKVVAGDSGNHLGFGQTGAFSNITDNGGNNGCRGCGDVSGKQGIGGGTPY